MKNFLRVAVLSLSLAGCAGTGGTPVTSGGIDVGTVIADIKLGCGVIIGANSVPAISALIGTVPFGSDANAIAQLVCQSFVAIAGSRKSLAANGEITVVINGISITGTYGRAFSSHFRPHR